MQPQTKRIKDVESSQSESRNAKSAVVLTTHYLPCLNTLKEVLASNCVVTGVVFCNKKGLYHRVFQEFKRKCVNCARKPKNLSNKGFEH